MGKEYMGTSRTSFLISPEGTIEKIYEGVKPDTHAEIVLEDLTKLQG
jgi:peroxiredoxin Q/BCP